MRIERILLAAAVAGACAPAIADFNANKPITATVTGATPSGYPRTMVEGLNAVVRDAYPGSAVSFKPNSPGGGVQAIATDQADFTATATGTEVRLANEGGAPFKEPLKGKFSYVMQLYDNQFIHFLMTKEWADANGVKSWADIAAKQPKMRLAINRPDNPQTTIGAPYQVMKAYGFSIEDIEKWGGSYVLECIAFAVAMVTFASFALQGFLGLRPIPLPLRIALIGCAVATASPRFDVTLGVTALGAAILMFVRLRPGRRDAAV